jgi:hypothetical protein
LYWKPRYLPVVLKPYIAGPGVARSAKTGYLAGSFSGAAPDMLPEINAMHLPVLEALEQPPRMQPEHKRNAYLGHDVNYFTMLMFFM